MLSVLHTGGANIPIIDGDTDSGANLEVDQIFGESTEFHAIERHDHIIDLLQALAFIDDPENAYCYAPGLPEEGDNCIEYLPETGFISYAPNDPFRTPESVPDGYLLPPFYTNPAIPLPGVIPSDAMVNFLSFPIFENLADLLTSGLPRFRFEFTGSGEIEIELVRVPQGGLALITMDGGATVRKVVNLSSVALGNVGSLGEIFDIFIDGDGVDTEVVEIKDITVGGHYVDVTFLPNLGTDVVFGFGGGLRRVSFCPDSVPGENVMPIFEVIDCVLTYKPNPAAAAVELVDLTTCVIPPEPAPVFLRENLATGLEVDDNPGFTSPTLIHAYYRADALRRAVAFYAQAADANLAIFNVAGDQIVRFGITPAGGGAAAVTLDARNATGGLRIWAAGSGSNRSMYFDPVNGRVSIETGFPQATAVKSQFHVSAGSDADHSIRSEGRPLNSVAQIVAYRSADTATGDLFAGNLNGQGFLFRVTNEAALIFRNSMTIMRKRAGISTNIEAHSRQTEFAEDSGANWRSRVIDRVSGNTGTVETMRQEIIGGAAALGVLGAAASNRIVLTGNAEGNQLLLDLANALDTFGWVESSGLTLGLDCCESQISCRRWDFTNEPFNSDWNIVDGEYTAFVGWQNDNISQTVRMNMFVTPDVEFNEIRIWGDTLSGTGNVAIKIWDASQSILYIDISIGASSPFSATSSALTPPVIGDGFYIELTPDVDVVVALTAFEVDYYASGGEPSGGDVCIP